MGYLVPIELCPPFPLTSRGEREIHLKSCIKSGTKGYSESRDQEGGGLKSAQQIVLETPSRAGGVAQDVGSEFKPYY
jgi:hypothetical protein